MTVKLSEELYIFVFTAGDSTSTKVFYIDSVKEADKSKVQLDIVSWPLQGKLI